MTSLAERPSRIAPGSHAARTAARRAALVVAVAGAGAGLAGCSSAAAPGPSAPLKAVAAAPPPKDDGKPAQAQSSGTTVNHSAALEQLRTAGYAYRNDKQNSIHVPLPDAPNWTRVRFLTVKSLVGFRYGKDHHAIVAAFVTHVDDNMAQGACSKSFEGWAMPLVETFEVDLHHDPPAAFSWTLPSAPGPASPASPASPAAPGSPPVPAGGPGAAPSAPKTIAIVEVDSLMAKTATVLSNENYAAAWTTYPAWPGACLVLGVAIPARDDEPRAREVRDRFVKDVFPGLKVMMLAEPKERF